VVAFFLFLSQAHHNLHCVVAVHPSPSFTLQLDKAQGHCQVSCSEIIEMVP